MAIPDIKSAWVVITYTRQSAYVDSVHATKESADARHLEIHDSHGVAEVVEVDRYGFD